MGGVSQAIRPFAGSVGEALRAAVGYVEGGGDVIAAAVARWDAGLCTFYTTVCCFLALRASGKSILARIRS